MSDPRSFEEIDVGERAEFGAYEVTESEILEYAERYDPQPFHTDPAHAAESAAFFDEVIAPGWLVASISQRLLVEHYTPTMRNIAAKGADDLRWRAPVTAGDVLTCRVEVVDKEAHREDRGRVDLRIELYDGDDELVFGFVGLVIVERSASA
ncbi:MAG: MaoC/PaaZ C-terminal domain-containing protein [Haloferacaceae archaeon]